MSDTMIWLDPRKDVYIGGHIVNNQEQETLEIHQNDGDGVFLNNDPDLLFSMALAIATLAQRIKEGRPALEWGNEPEVGDVVGFVFKE